jgi:hypothetical protein
VQAHATQLGSPPNSRDAISTEHRSWILKFSRKFPFISLSVNRGVKEKLEPEQLMLRGLVRWEPLTGNYNVKEIQRTMDLRTAYLNSGGKNKAESKVLRIEHTRLNQAFHPLSASMIREAQGSTNCETETIGMCRDLQRLLSTSSEATDAATTLARAIERTMKVLGEGDYVLWRKDSDPFRQDPDPVGQRKLKFNTFLVGGAYDDGSVADLQELIFHVTETRTRGRDDTTWIIDMDVVSSVICLWLFSLELRRNAARKLAFATRKLSARGYDQLSRATAREEYVAATQLFTERDTYYRIVASGRNPRHQIHTELVEYTSASSWLKDRIRKLPVLGESRADFVEELDSRDPMDNTWVVWGANNSMLWE